MTFLPFKWLFLTFQTLHQLDSVVYFLLDTLGFLCRFRDVVCLEVLIPELKQFIHPLLLAKGEEKREERREKRKREERERERENDLNIIP